jgi:hypothetical protein
MDTSTTPKYSIKYVFKRVPPWMRLDLLSFWETHREDWVSTTREPQAREYLSVKDTPRARTSALLKNVVCVAQTNDGTIAGAAWINVAMMPVDTSKPELIYFQRMYISPEHRCARLANQLINSFHHHLKQCNQRSPLVKYLLADNANTKLKTPSGRRMFIRKGFKFMGFNTRGNEIWKLSLPPTRGPSISACIQLLGK